MSLQHVRAESALFLHDRQQKDRLFDANDVDGRRCLVTLKRLAQTPGYISLTCATVVHPVKERPKDWAEEYAKLQQADGGRYEVRDGYHHGGRILFMLLSSVEDNHAAAESIVKKVDEFLYTLRGLDDHAAVWRIVFQQIDYPTALQVHNWLGPYGSVHQ
jgi:hypothetical protein